MNMENKSVWSKYLKESFNSLEKDIECDVLIIGGGISGVLTAYYLNESKQKIVLVERNTIGSGISSKMTAKVTILQDILTKIEEKDLNLYLKSQLEGLKLLKKNIINNKIECDFFKNDSYLYTSKKTNIKKLKKIEKLLENNNIDCEEETIPLKELDSKFAIKINDSYVINPIKYINEIVKLSNNINFYLNTNIIEVIKEDDCYIARTINNKIICKKIIFATNYPYFLKPLFFPIKVRLEKSYIGYGKSNIKDTNFNLINIDKDTNSIRFYADKMIYLKGSRLISNKVNDTNNFNNLFNNKIIKEYDNIWSNIDIITNDYLPIIGEVFKDMYILTGYNTWGILSSHIGAKIISQEIIKRKKYIKYQELFKPRKIINLKRFVNSSLNVYENINGFIKGTLTKNKLIFYSKDKAMYVDNNGSCYIVKRKCPHLKCNLLFNEVEKSWDCPCHASRFDLFGNVISGPSKYDIKIDKDY